MTTPAWRAEIVQPPWIACGVAAAEGGLGERREHQREADPDQDLGRQGEPDFGLRQTAPGRPGRRRGGSPRPRRGRGRPGPGCRAASRAPPPAASPRRRSRRRSGSAASLRSAAGRGGRARRRSTRRPSPAPRWPRGAAGRSGAAPARSPGSTSRALATARIGTAAASAIGTWSRKIDCQETSWVRMPPSAGPSAAPVAPAVAQIAVARRSEPTVAGSSSSDAVTASAPPIACTRAGDDQGREVIGEPAGEPGTGEDREPDRGRPPRPDPAGDQRRRHRGQRHHQVEGDQHPGDPEDARCRGPGRCRAGRGRRSRSRRVRGRPPVRAPQTRGFGLPRSIAQLVTVLIPVLLLPFEHEFDVGARFRIGDVFDLQPAPPHLSALPGPAL